MIVPRLMMFTPHRYFVLVLLTVTGLAAQAAAPAGRFVVSDDMKTVTDTKTGLVWQRGVANSTKNWADARAWCHTNGSNLPDTGWRLPSVEELQTIVDTSVYRPAIDWTAFTYTPSDFFWTSTPLAGSSSHAWYVFFDSGGVGRRCVSLYHLVRCVR